MVPHRIECRDRKVGVAIIGHLRHNGRTDENDGGMDWPQFQRELTRVLKRMLEVPMGMPGAAVLEDAIHKASNKAAPSVTAAYLDSAYADSRQEKTAAPVRRRRQSGRTDRSRHRIPTH